MWISIAALTIAAAAATAPNDDVAYIRQSGEPTLCVRHSPGPGAPVLYIHGATFPSALSIFYRIDGRSWADDLHTRGFDVWGLDFAGYGCSDRPASMQGPAMDRGQVPGRAADASRQIERATSYILSHARKPRLSIIAHSWGTIPAGLFAGQHPDQLAKLVLFGPVAQRAGDTPASGSMKPSTLVSADDQWESFQSRTPADAPMPIQRSTFDPWVAAYLDSDPTSAGRSPRSARVPAGPDADFDDSWSGHFPYNPASVRSPTMIVRGEWDSIARDADAAWLAHALTNVPGGAIDVKLRRGAHRMHLEDNRQALFDAVGDFLGSAR